MDQQGSEGHDPINRAKHWLYEPLLDGHNPTRLPDPLVEKARQLRRKGAVIVCDKVVQEGDGVVHKLEWIDPTE